MSASSHYRTLLKIHQNTKKNYSLAFRELDSLIRNNELNKNSFAVAEQVISSDRDTQKETTDVHTLFSTIHSCLLARSKMEDHHFLPILQEDVQLSQILSQEQKKAVQSLKKDHIIEHQSLNHARKWVDALYSHNKHQQSEAMRHVRGEIDLVHQSLDTLLHKEEELILYPLIDSILGEERRKELVEELRQEQQQQANSNNSQNHGSNHNVIAIANSLADATLSDILKFKNIAEDQNTQVANTILKEFSKAVPHHIWLNISVKHEGVSNNTV